MAGKGTSRMDGAPGKLATLGLATLALASLVFASPAFGGADGSRRVERLPESDTLTCDETRAPLERERRVRPSILVDESPAVDTKPTPVVYETLPSAGTASGSLRQPVEGEGVVTYVGCDPATYFHMNQDELNPENGQACGTTSLAMILANAGLLDWSLEAGLRVDRAVRPWGGFSAPRDLLDYGREAGLAGRAVNDATFADLERALANGNSVMAMVEGGSSPHWIVVLGVETNYETGEKFVSVADPGNHAVSRRSLESFLEQWATPMNGAVGSFLGGAVGYHNYFLAFDHDGGRLPAGGAFGVTATENAADGVTDVANAWSQLRDGQFITAATGAASGVIKAVTALPGLVGNVIETAGDHVTDWAFGRLTAGGLGNAIVGLGAAAVGMTVGVVGAVVGAVGNVVSAVGGFVGNTVKRVGRFIGRLFGR